MAQIFEECLLQAIKKDDIKAFNALMENAQCGTYRLGRFPVLSLLYLYKSRSILSEYEQKFLKITTFEPFREPVEISKKFSAKAGKCLRLYIGEVVSPLEMLLILDKTRRLRRVYPLTKPSQAVKDRLKSIYSIKYSLNITFEGDEIIIDKRPLSYREKRNIATACLCSVLAVTIVVGVPVATVSLIPKPVEGEVKKLSQIDFSSQKEYTLKRDIVIPENYSVEKVCCTIYGEGNKLILGKGASLGELDGKLSDVTIESSGDAVFTSICETASIESVTVNVSADFTANEGTAMLALTNYGAIDEVTLNVSGSISAVAEGEEVNDGLTFGALVQNNDYKYNEATKTVYRGVITNCTVNYSQLMLVGETGANASFGGVAGINSGFLQDCTVTGKITADTFDIAGVCSVNNWLLSGNINEADLTQTSSETDWNPITCGIVLNNAYAVENCENRGKIISVSNCGEFEAEEGTDPTVSASGIAHLNRGSVTSPYIYNCINLGDVECGAEYRTAYASGVCVSSSGGIEKCKNGGAITVTSNNEIYAGGISSISYGKIYYSVNEGAINAVGKDTAYVGGISAHTCAQFTYCYSGGEITVESSSVCAGGIFGYSEATIYGYYVYCGSADFCISEVNFNVSASNRENCYVGGIAGRVYEAGHDSGDSVTYYGGCITYSYFIGTCTSELSCFGGIAGVSGANIYETNLYSSGFAQYHNFDGNYYLTGNYTAFGGVIKDDGECVQVEDKGASSAQLEEMQNTQAYKAIVNALEK